MRALIESGGDGLTRMMVSFRSSICSLAYIVMLSRLISNARPRALLYAYPFVQFATELKRTVHISPIDVI
jgi:hypothetical protein